MKVKMNYPVHKLKYCRNCLNKTFRINMQRKSVYIYSYPMECRCCGESKNIIYKTKFPYNVILHFKLKRIWKDLFTEDELND